MINKILVSQDHLRASHFYMYKLGVFCAAVLLLLPNISLAQSYRGMRGFTSEFQTQINALSPDAVQNFPIPTALGVEVNNLTKNFGDPRDGGTRTHEGLDILAPKYTPVASPTDAVVTSFGDGTDSGLYVRTANPGGESFVYMHLTSFAAGIARGLVLKRGDLIGFVGNTGNASGGVTHLHFEVRKGGTPTDPFPRLTQTFTPDERAKIAAAAQAQGIVLPTGTAAPSTDPNILQLGDQNSQVTTLQKFLINKNAGPAAQALVGAGATGYFGAITEAALVEYQQKASLQPSGIVDAATHQLVFGLSAEGDSSDIPDDTGTATTTPTTPTSTVFTRDLDIGATGTDVKALQKFLNDHGFAIALSGVGSAGQETTYFGVLTQKALATYQAAQGITPSAGYFGPKTRARILLMQ